MKTGFYISHNDWMKIQHYARARHDQMVDKRQLSHEIGGMMIAQLDKDNDWILSDPTILKQTTSRGNCTLDKTALADYYIEMAQKHDKNIQFVWWHSHGNMPAFWSGTDKDTMKESASGLWSMFLVVNIKEEYQFRVQMWEPLAIGEDIELNIMNAPGDAIPKSILTEVTAKCSEEYNTWKAKNNYYHTNGNNQLTLGGNLTDRQEIKDYNKGFGIQDDEDIAVQYLINKLDELNTKLMAGEIQHKAYRKAIDRYNAKMESNRFDFRINLPKSNTELDSLIPITFAWDMIVDKDTGQAYTPDYEYGAYCV